MIVEIGHLALVIALCLAVVQGVVPIAGAARRNATWLAVGRSVARGQFGFILLAYACLTYAFIVSDFSVLYVAEQSNTALPVQYRIAAVWGGHEGSLLLWILMLGGWTTAVTLFSRHLPEEMAGRVVGVMGLVSVGFLLFTLFTSNPFERILPAPMEGRDLNPLLQDPGLIFHPPMLYMGYVGFSVAFAFAIAALLGGRLDATWARWSRPWTTAAWSLLTMGIALGSWWAYYELGWGGWWFWDPVENASFMPWLVGTALIHSLAATEKRGSAKNWTVLLAILTFSLSLLGTFLVRSGVLTSVHAFATDPSRGVFILAFLVVVVGGSLLLYAWRAPKVGLGGRFDWSSRESLLLTNNVLLTVAAGTVLLGTLYPLLLDALGMGKISVGPPYFDSVFVPLMVPAAFLMAVGPFARWKKARLPELAVRLRWALAAGVATSVLLPLVMGRWSPLIALGILLATWIIFASVQNLVERVRSTRGGLRGLPRSFVGMHLAHIGVAIFIVGVTVVRAYEEETDVRMEVGSTVTVGGYTFRFEGVTQQPGPNYVAQIGNVAVLKDGRGIVRLHPEKRVYRVRTMPMTEAAIYSSVLRDLYVSLGEPLEGGAWSVRVYYKPFVSWIWGGCLAMAFGGGLCISDRRYRLALGGRVRSKPPEVVPRRRGPERPLMARRLLPLALFLVLVIFLAAGLRLNPSEVPSPLVDRPAPPFNLPTLGEPERLVSQQDMLGQVWLLNVWASWCISCREEHPLLIKLAARGELPIYGLDYKDAEADGLAWLEHHGDPYVLSVVDRDGRIGIDYGVYGVPETYLIDPEGVIRYKQIGPLNSQVIEETILPMARELQP